MKLVFECTALKGVNKEGKLTPDEKGYYTTVLGAYGMKNSAGLTYDRDAAVRLFESDRAIFHRWIDKGILHGEIDHPSPRPYMVNGKLDRDAYFARLRHIEPRNYAVHIRKVTLKEMVNDEGQPILAVIGEVKPVGEIAETIRQGLENPDANVYFSVRSFTEDDMIRGIRYTIELVTWDFVHEGGIAMAQKMRSPALECFEAMEVTREMILKANAMDEEVARCTGQESVDNALDNVMSHIGLKTPKTKASLLHTWK